MDITIDHTVDFDAPPDRLWACFTDFGCWSIWMETTGFPTLSLGFRWAEGQGPGPGRKIAVESNGVFLHNMVAREWSPPGRLRLTSEPGPGALLHFDMTLTLGLISEQSTNVVMRLELRALQELPRLPFWLAWRFPVQKLAQTKIASVIQQVKDTIQQSAV